MKTNIAIHLNSYFTAAEKKIAFFRNSILTLFLLMKSMESTRGDH